MHIFHLASDLGPTSTGRQLSFLVPKLAARGVTQTIVNLGGDVPFGASVSATRFRIRNAFDLSGLLHLRRFVAKTKPDIVHLWGEQPRTIRFALRDHSLISPAIPPMISIQNHFSRSEARAKLGLSTTARVIVTADRFETVHAIRNAYWAIDLMKPTSPDYVLLILGDGPSRPRAEAFARKLGADDNRARFLGIRTDVSDILAAADVAWNTRTNGGLQFTAEAMAHGLPVVGFTQHTGLRAFVNDGITGSLATDPFKLAGATHMLFQDDGKRIAMGQAAKQIINESASTPEAEADRLMKEYANASGHRPQPLH